MSKEVAQVLPHNYDGIEEFDNRLPNWWLMTLFGAIVFAVFYWSYYEGLAIGPSAADNFAAEQKEAEAAIAVRVAAEKKKNPLSDAMLESLAAAPDVVAKGAAIWATSCVACHADKGQGLVGPNLTDAFWINGGTPLAIHKAISEGIPAKGMLAWGPTLGATKVKEVTAFVLSIRGQNLKGKEPQGEKVGPK